MVSVGFRNTASREIRRMTSRTMYLGAMIVVPVLMLLFFVSLLGPGLPIKVPTAVVDLDHSTMSRAITRSLGATELIQVSEYCDSYDQAMARLRSGKIFGFIMIPADFERDVIAGRTPTLSYYNNLAYFVPGTLTFKGFKTVAVTTAGAVVQTQLMAVGADGQTVSALIQPVNIEGHPIGNPWLSYAVYLTPTFMIALLALMIYLVTVLAVTSEIKEGTSPQWLAGAHGHISVALAGKLLPHFAVWSVTGQFTLAVMFRFCHFPCGDIWAMAAAMELFIIACQAWALFVTCLFPNPRLAFSCCALCGVLSFSFTGISFPVESMYGSIAIFSYLVPVRYMMLIYFTVALDSFPVYFARWHYVGLMIFPCVAAMLLWKLKRAALSPVYVP